MRSVTKKMPLYYYLGLRDHSGLPKEDLDNKAEERIRIKFYQQNEIRPHPFHKNISTIIDFKIYEK